MIETKTSQTESAEIVDLNNKWAARVGELFNNRINSLVTISQEKVLDLRSAARGLSSSAKRIGQVAAVAGGITLLAACGGGDRSTATPTAIPIEIPTQVPTAIPTESATQTPDATYTPQTEVTTTVTSPKPEEVPPTPTPEQQAESLVLSGYLETSLRDPAYETIKLAIPEEVLAGEHIKVSLLLKGGETISEVVYPYAEWLKQQDVLPWTMPIQVTEVYREINMEQQMTYFIDGLAQNGVKFQNPEKLAEIKFRQAFYPGEGLAVEITLPNVDLIYITRQGSFMVNPAKEFAHGSAFEIKREGDRSAITASWVVLSWGETESQHLPDFEISVPLQSEIIVGGETPNVGSQSPSENPTPIVVTSQGGPTLENQPTQQESSSGQEYQPNEKIRLSDWWNGMVASGEIVISDLAKNYGGEKIRQLEDIVRTGYLIPNPDGPARVFSSFAHLGSCKDLLNQLVVDGMGYTSVSQKAFREIPGGDNCIVAKID